MGYRSDEQETVISYDRQTGKRRVYSTYGPHARMFEKAVKDGAQKERLKAIRARKEGGAVNGSD